MLILSLCYCGLTSASGEPLGEVVCKTAVREYYLDGNRLECDGVIELLRLAAVHAEAEHIKQIEDEKLKALMMAEGALEGKIYSNKLDFGFLLIEFLMQGTTNFLQHLSSREILDPLLPTGWLSCNVNNNYFYGEKSEHFIYIYIIYSPPK